MKITCSPNFFEMHNYTLEFYQPINKKNAFTLHTTLIYHQHLFHQPEFSYNTIDIDMYTTHPRIDRSAVPDTSK